MATSRMARTRYPCQTHNFGPMLMPDILVKESTPPAPTNNEIGQLAIGGGGFSDVTPGE